MSASEFAQSAEFVVDGRPVLVTSSTAYASIPVDELRATALARMPADAALCDLAAGRHHGLWLPERSGAPEVCVPGRTGPARDRPHSRQAQVRYRRRNLRPDDVVVVDGVPVTSISRTWIDLAEKLDVADLVAAGDSALRSGVSHAELDDQVHRAGRRRGVRRAREALGHLDARSRSRGESCLRYVLVSAGLPKPEVNEPVVVGGEWIGEPDLSYFEARIAIEYQGAVHAERVRMRKDITRKLDFGDIDWLVIEAGPAEVFRFQERIIHRVRFEYARRIPR